MAGGSHIGLGPIFGLAAALSWGTGDFCGGLFARYASVTAAVLTSQAVGFAATLAILAVSGEQGPSQDALVWGSLAGASGVAGVGFFYFALARGTMGVVAPLAALIGAGVPVIVAVIGGESVSTLRLIGMAIALVAVVLISLPAKPVNAADRRSIRKDIAELPYVILTGLGFAGFFIGVDKASVDGATWWPLAFVRAAGLALVGVAFVAFVIGRRSGTLRERASQVLGIDRLRAGQHRLPVLILLFLGIGLGDLGGNVFFVLASHADVFSVAVVLASLYPVVTTVLAAVLLHERLRRVQVIGVVLATISVPLLR